MLFQRLHDPLTRGGAVVTGPRVVALPTRLDVPLDCPICGREMGFEQHRMNTPFSVQHQWLIHRLGDMGIAAKVIARIIHSTPNTIGQVLHKHRHGWRTQ